jgi:hypothetical protein
MVFNRKVSEIVVEHKDRLCRFEFDLMEWLFSRYGVTIRIENELEITPAEELTKDLLSIITIFSARYNGMRRYQQKGDTKVHESESENETNNRTETNITTMDGNVETAVQSSTESSKKRSQSKLYPSKKSTSTKKTNKCKRTMDAQSS